MPELRTALQSRQQGHVLLAPRPCLRGVPSSLGAVRSESHATLQTMTRAEIYITQQRRGCINWEMKPNCQTGDETNKWPNQTVSQWVSFLLGQNCPPAHQLCGEDTAAEMSAARVLPTNIPGAIIITTVKEVGSVCPGKARAWFRAQLWLSRDRQGVLGEWGQGRGARRSQCFGGPCVQSCAWQLRSNSFLVCHTINLKCVK